MQVLASAALKYIQPRGDDDMVDRINYYYTAWIILLCCGIATGRQYIGKPMQCWVPPQFTHSMEEYIENYCWIQNTYWIPLHSNIPDDIRSREELQLGYYQWTPFILALEALMFYIPAGVWRMLSWQSGVNIQFLVGLAREDQCLDVKTRQEAIDNVAQSLEDVLSLQKTLGLPGFRSPRFCIPRKLRMCYVTILYLLVKFLYAVNVVGQFFLLNVFLKAEKYNFYGVEVLVDLVTGEKWTQSGHFPRVTLCDFEVKYLGNTNRYTVQCALLANLFNEKIFVFLWCWFCVVTLLTTISLFSWLGSVLPFQQRNFVMNYIKIATKRTGSATNPAEFGSRYIHRRFADDHLGSDGVFVLRMLAAHVGDIIAMDVVHVLWLRYLRRHAGYRENSVRDGQSNHALMMDSSDTTLFDALNEKV